MVVQFVQSAVDFYAALRDVRYKHTMVNYTAKWCGPCKQMSFYYNDLAKMFTPHVQFLKVDVDELPEVAQWARVSAMPTFVLYEQGGRPVAHSIGADRKALRDMLVKFSTPPNEA